MILGKVSYLWALVFLSIKRIKPNSEVIGSKGNNICKALLGIANRYEVSFGGDANVLKLDYGGGCKILEIY